MISYRKRLLASTVTTFIGGLAMIAPQAASAQCATVGDTRTCLTTPTTDTTGNGPVDRNGQYNSVGVPTFLVIPTGQNITGFGLAWSPTASGTNTTTVTNNGSVTVSAGNLATAGGSGALSINALGATPVIYGGNGSVTNLGTAGNGLEFTMGGSGSLTANVGGNATSAVGGTAIFLTTAGTGTGANSITTATGTTLRGDLVGAWVSQTNAANASAQTLNNNSTVASLTGAPGTLDFGIGIQNAGTGATTVFNSGTIGATTDRTVTEGIFNVISNGASTATLSTTGTGAIFTAGTGIINNNLGTGSNIVNYSGPIDSTGAFGIRALSATGPTTVITGAGAVTASGAGGVGIVVNAGTGATTVTTGTGAVTGTSFGIQAATTGTQTITANAAVTGATAGIHSDTTAARTIMVGSTGNVTGTTQAILLTNTGTASVSSSGTIGAASTGLAVQATGAGATTVTNNAAGTLNGRLTLTANADTLTNAGTFNTQGTTDFGAAADVLNNNATGVINILGATTFANLETFNQNGRINLNANTLTLSGTPFTNAGTIDTSGNAAIAGITAFNNSGTLDLAAGTFTVPAVVFTNTGTILADEGSTTITGQTNFANSGTIDLQDGVADDVLTINSTYVGSGGSNLLIDFNDTQSDRLLTLAASGSTTVNANYVGAGLIDVDGVLVVDTTATTSNAFILGSVGGNTSPLVDYNLVQIGTDYFLTSTPNPEAFDPVAISNLASSIWYQSADEVVAQTDLPSGLVGFGAWGQVYYSQDKFGDDDEVAVIDGVAFAVDNELETDRYGVQLGVEYGFGGGRFGLTGGYGVAKSDNDLGSDLKAKGWNIGVYGAFGGLTGFHGSALLKHDRYDLEFDGGAFEGFDGDLKATGVDGSLGYRFGIGGAATLDAKVGLAHVRTKVDDITAFGFDYDIGTVTSTRGRAGLRASFGGDLGFYAEGMVLREFDGDGNVELFDGASFYDIDFGRQRHLVPTGSWPRSPAWVGSDPRCLGRPRRQEGLRSEGWLPLRRSPGRGASASAPAAPAAAAPPAASNADLPRRVGNPGDGRLPAAAAAAAAGAGTRARLSSAA